MWCNLTFLNGIDQIELIVEFIIIEHLNIKDKFINEIKHNILEKDY